MSAAELLTVPGVVAHGKDARIASLPTRLYPVRDLLTSEDPHDRMVLDDWIESQDWNVAADLWLLTKPTKFQRTITLMVIGRNTTMAHYPGLTGREKLAPGQRYWTDEKAEKLGRRLFRLAIEEARRQLLIHRHAHWVRLVDTDAQTSPQGEEAMMDLRGVPRDELGEKRVHFRVRCKVSGCVISSTGTQRIGESNGKEQP